MTDTATPIWKEWAGRDHGKLWTIGELEESVRGAKNPT